MSILKCFRRPNCIFGEKGSALVQVMVVSTFLLIVVAGVTRYMGQESRQVEAGGTMDLRVFLFEKMRGYFNDPASISKSQKVGRLPHFLNSSKFPTSIFPSRSFLSSADPQKLYPLLLLDSFEGKKVPVLHGKASFFTKTGEPCFRLKGDLQSNVKSGKCPIMVSAFFKIPNRSVFQIKVIVKMGINPFFQASDSLKALFKDPMGGKNPNERSFVIDVP